MTLDPHILLFIPVFLFALTFHEFAHAWTAKKAGDLTAAYAGRLSLNPLVHIDPVGTIILPIAALLLNFPMIGWARPVPVNQLRFRKEIWIVWVSLAGPASNILLALIATLALKLGLPAAESNVALAGLIPKLAAIFIQLNLVLAVFNMLPIPPLDGSSLVYYFLVRRMPQLWDAWVGLTRYGFIILWLLVAFVPPFQRLLAIGFRLPATLLLEWALR
ncbi:MAG: site-2 protease family protein [Candidatus Sumerlaeaceae bacterium]|jgi:Zn-dependent protease